MRSHNFYWENQGQGQRMRQKAIEAPAMKSEASFLHYNRFMGETFNPNAGKAQSHIYDVPSRIEYLHKESGGPSTHYSVDNRPVADYSDPSGYDPTTHSYPDIPSGVPQKGENKNLGGLSAHKHLELAKQTDTSQFPYSTVLRPGAPGFTFKPDWRSDVPGYMSPPPSPSYLAPDLVEDEEVRPGNLKRKRHFHDDVGDEDEEALIVDAEHDEAQDETTLERKRRRVGRPEDWPEGGKRLFKHVTSLAAIGAMSGGSGVDPTDSTVMDLAKSDDGTMFGGDEVEMGESTGDFSLPSFAELLASLNRPRFGGDESDSRGPYGFEEAWSSFDGGGLDLSGSGQMNLAGSGSYESGSELDLSGSGEMNLAGSGSYASGGELGLSNSGEMSLSGSGGLGSSGGFDSFGNSARDKGKGPASSPERSGSGSFDFSKFDFNKLDFSCWTATATSPRTCTKETCARCSRPPAAPTSR